jgi:hypothetical protein
MRRNARLSQHILLIQDDPLDAAAVRTALTTSKDGPFQVEWVRRCGEGLDRLTDNAKQHAHRANGNADFAMYQAKDSGRNNYQFFQSELNVSALARQTITSLPHDRRGHRPPLGGHRVHGAYLDRRSKPRRAHSRAAVPFTQ